MKKAAVAAGGGKQGGTVATAAPTDLLVCFPARARQHLVLMPKPICSPSRSTVDKAAALRRRRHRHHHLQLPGATGGASGRGSGSGSSPMFRGPAGRGRHAAQGEEDDEPRSPKVTCVGQIKAGRPKKPRAAAAGKGAGGGGGAGAGGGKSWITVVEEIERLHGRRKKVGWLEAVGIRRDALPLLGGALRALRLKTRCFGSLHGAAVDASASTDEDGGAGEGERGGGGGGRHRDAGGSAAAASVFSKWLMVLEGGQEPLDLVEEQDSRDDDADEERHRDEHDGGRQGERADEPPSAPPPNALLLMRCRSAPAKGLSPLSVSRRADDAGPPAGEVEQEKEDDVTDGSAEEGRDELVFMSTAPGFLKLSIDIAKETWVVGGGDPLSRSRSWKR